MENKSPGKSLRVRVKLLPLLPSAATARFMKSLMLSFHLSTVLLAIYQQAQAMTFRAASAFRIILENSQIFFAGITWMGSEIWSRKTKDRWKANV
ncbi:hypothetical protein HNR78_001056 [Parageobacillus toebii NBRC 107807]|uniref:Uncharacterized protein n=1 Tax=Parageobacillus toebii NBRC 107807 TaxID=1223503 RepID=A0AA89NIG8_9BACL|nr:hypothetical protein [Parageobacillus toebii NBRC 107807]